MNLLAAFVLKAMVLTAARWLRSAPPERSLSPMAKIVSISEHFHHFLADLEGQLLGRSGRQDAAGVEAFSGSRVGTDARPVHGSGQL
jgi:hypothetical protein